MQPVMAMRWLRYHFCIKETWYFDMRHDNLHHLDASYIWIYLYICVWLHWVLSALKHFCFVIVLFPYACHLILRTSVILIMCKQVNPCGGKLNRFCAHVNEVNDMMTSSNGSIFRVTGSLCGEFIGPGEFPAQRPVTWNFDVFFYLHLNTRLSIHLWCWWFETPSWSLWRQCNRSWTKFTNST